jgi:hypothetical protein
VYDLPQAGLYYPFDRNQARGLGREWILFHHLKPSAEILDWLDETQPFLLTAVRHPADVLVSLYHHLHKFETGGVDVQEARAMLASPFQRGDIVTDATGSFEEDLECSLRWMRTGRAAAVRYEDLWRDVHLELTRITNLISPVPERKIELAIERCDFSLMRKLAGDYGRFFRSGKAGSWPHELPPEILAEFQRQPYQSLVSELGYSMDPNDPITAAPRIQRPSINPFRKEGSALSDIEEGIEEEFRFDNGVPVAPLIVDLYLALCEKFQWPGNPSATQAGSYFEWLNEPCDITGRDTYNSIRITNLALQLHSLRPDLNQSFLDLRGPARADYADWFVRGGAQEEGLDAHFIQPVRESLKAWAIARSPEDFEPWPWWPKLPNFALHLHRSSPALQAEYPDIKCFDRWSFLEWIVSHQPEANINPDFLGPVQQNLKSLSKLRRVGRYVPGARARIAGA